MTATTRTRSTAAAARAEKQRQGTIEFTNMVLANGTCTRPTLPAVGTTSVCGTLLFTLDDEMTTGVWEVVDNTTGNRAVYLSLPTAPYSVALVQNSHAGIARSHSATFATKQAAWEYLRTVRDTLPGRERAIVAWNSPLRGK